MITKLADCVYQYMYLLRWLEHLKKFVNRPVDNWCRQKGIKGAKNVLNNLF